MMNAMLSRGFQNEGISVGERKVGVSMRNQFLKFFGDGQIWKEVSQLTNSIQSKMKLSKVIYSFTHVFMYATQSDNLIFFSS